MQDNPITTVLPEAPSETISETISEPMPQSQDYFKIWLAEEDEEDEKAMRVLEGAGHFDNV